MEQMTVTTENQMAKAPYLEICGTLPRSEFEAGSIPKEGIAYASVVWPWQKTIILLPPTEIRPEQTWINLVYLEDMLDAIKRETAARNSLSRFIPLRWRIYACHLGSVTLVDLKHNLFEPPGPYRSGEIARFIQDKTSQHLAAERR